MCEVTKTDISEIPYHKRYKTDDDGYRWVMLEESKNQIAILQSEMDELKEQLENKCKCKFIDGINTDLCAYHDYRKSAVRGLIAHTQSLLDVIDVRGGSLYDDDAKAAIVKVKALLGESQ